MHRLGVALRVLLSGVRIGEGGTGFERVSRGAEVGHGVRAGVCGGICYLHTMSVR